jgi:integrase
LHSADEIRKLLDASLQIPCRYERGALRPWTYHRLFGLLTVSGMHLGEVRNLELQDLDLTATGMTIRGAKFGNYAAFLAMPIWLRLDHDDAGEEPAGRHSRVAWIGIVSITKDP